MEEKIVVLCSGGFDSIVMLNELIQYEHRSVDNIYVLFFNYGQHNYNQERRCVEKIVRKFNIPFTNVLGITLPSFAWADCSLTNSNIVNSQSLESQYLPMRNLIFFSYALSLAQSKGCSAIYSAILSGGTYDDTKSEFLSNISKLSMEIGIELRFPYADFGKYGIAGIARMLGVQKDDFFSCNTPTPDGKPCGKCFDCKSIDYILDRYLEDNYPRQIITRNDYKVTPSYCKSYMTYQLEEIRMLINNKCNTKCTHCFYGFEDMASSPLTLDEWFEVIGESAKINPKMNFHFSGKEPLFDEKIFKIADYIDLYNNLYNTKLTYDMVTNGINIPKYLDDISSRNFTRVALSVDYEGCTRVSGGHEFNIISLLNSVGVPVHCFIVAHNDNINKIPDMIYDLYHNSGVKNFFIKDVINIGSGSNMELLTTKQYSELYDNITNELLSDDYNDIEVIFYVKGRHFWKLHNDKSCNLANDLEVWRVSGDDYFCEGKLILRPEYTCSRYLSQISVTPDGYVLGCGTELANPNYPDYSAGRLFTDGNLKTLLNYGRSEALESIQRCNCKNNIVCFHKKQIKPLDTK